MSLRFHEIAEAYNRILNPFTEKQLMLLGDICRLHPGMKQLDLACGKAEMLCRWAQKYGINGVGVDISTVFLDSAKKRAAELKVTEQLTFVQGDAGKFTQSKHDFDVVSCIGATWIGNGLIGTLELMKPVLKSGGLLLVGEPYWVDEPPEDAYAALDVSKNDYVSLDGTLDRFESAGLRLIEMILADHSGWDRYEAPQWMAVDDFLSANPNDSDAPALYKWINKNRRAYLKYRRRYFNWGVFVLRLSE
ncbi:methyltransferase, type 12 [Desulfosarcina variabilis str. Montpellier]|uniref:SAM-dependent methyltransferase n=1 Tax=Desulfosarcina variabilis TaxID=2300 RepID=UPI003AFB7C9F